MKLVVVLDILLLLEGIVVSMPMWKMNQLEKNSERKLQINLISCSLTSSQNSNIQIKILLHFSTVKRIIILGDGKTEGKVRP